MPPRVIKDPFFFFFFFFALCCTRHQELWYFVLKPSLQLPLSPSCSLPTPSGVSSDLTAGPPLKRLRLFPYRFDNLFCAIAEVIP